MARVAALQKQFLLVHSCSLILSGGLLCQKAVWGQITHQQDIVWCPTVVLHFLEGPHYYSAGDFKHFSHSFSCSLMHSHAQRSLSSACTGCVFLIKALLTHMITGMAHWHMPSPLGNQALIFFPLPLHPLFPLDYRMTGMSESVFLKIPPVVMRSLP